jgi:MFS family permease
MENVCDSLTVNKKEIFSILSSILAFSMLLSGFLMDKFGRKKIIICKLLGSVILLLVLLVLGFVPSFH